MVTSSIIPYDLYKHIYRPVTQLQSKPKEITKLGIEVKQEKILVPC